MKPSALNFAAALLIALVSAGILSAPRTADACDPIQPGIFIYNELDLEQAIPLNGAWAVRVTVVQTSLSDLSIEVRDADDNLVDGALSQVAERETGLGTEFETSQSLVIWTPDELLLPEHEYRVDLRAPDPFDASLSTIEKQTTFQTTAQQETDFEAAATHDFPAMSVKESLGSMECCEDPTACNSCGDCQNCWPTQIVYQAMLEIDVILPTNDANVQAYHRFEDSNGFDRVYWKQEGVQSNHLLYPPGETGRFCTTLKSYVLATQELISEEEKCFEKNTLPPATDLRDVTRPETCEDEPDAGERPDAGHPDATDPSDQTDTMDETDATDAPDADTSNSDATPPEVGLDADAGCGCSATPTSPSSLLGMMLFFIALGASRLTLFSRRH